MPPLLLRLAGEPRGFGKLVEVSAPCGPGPFFVVRGRGLDLRGRAPGFKRELARGEIDAFHWMERSVELIHQQIPTVVARRGAARLMGPGGCGSLI